MIFYICFHYTSIVYLCTFFFFFFQAEDGIRDLTVTGVQTCALPISNGFFSAQSSLRGTDATLAQMVGLMDYTPGDVSRPAAIPSWTEIDYFDGAEIGRASCRERV